MRKVLCCDWRGGQIHQPLYSCYRFYKPYRLTALNKKTEFLDPSLLDLDTRSNWDVLSALLDSQQSAITAVRAVTDVVGDAVDAAVSRLQSSSGRLIMLGAGASGRLAVQDGAELWPTFGWPSNRLHLSIAGGNDALLESVEGVEDDEHNAMNEASKLKLDRSDVVVAVAASGTSTWTVSWLQAAKQRQALCIGIANNPDTPLLNTADHAIFLRSDAEVLGGSTRMAAGTAQKVALNLFSTTLMIRLNRTYGNLMVDMAAVNRKLDDRRVRMLQAIDPEIDEASAVAALDLANGWVKLAAVVVRGQTVEQGKQLLEKHSGSLRAVLSELKN